MSAIIQIKNSNSTSTPATLATGELAYSETSSTLFMGTSTPAVVAIAGSGVYAKLAGPSFTGTPAAPTASAGTNTTQVATTAFVQASFNSISPMTTLGDLEYESAANTASRLAGNTTSTTKFLTQAGTGTVSAAPGWNTIAAGDVPSLSASKITSGQISVAQGGTGLGTLTAHAVVLGEGTSTPGFAAIGTAGNVLTDNGSGADPTFQAPPVATYRSSALGSPYTLTTSFASSGLTITLPATGTYLLSGAIRGILVGTSTATGSATGNAYIVAHLYDVTNSVVVPNSVIFVLFSTWQVTTVVVNNQSTAGFGPVPYSITGSAVIQLRGLYSVGSAVTLTNVQFGADSNGGTVLTGLRIY